MPSTDAAPNALVRYVGSTVVFGRHGSGPALRRIRFPQADSGYAVRARSQVNVHAGCFGPSCAVRPNEGGWGGNSANWWYVVPRATAIRGMTVFMSNGQAHGTNGVKGCVRVVQQGGKDVTTPWCFKVAAQKFGPSTYDAAFGPQQHGSAFVPFTMAVPAQMLIGIDFSLFADSNTGLDFAGYLWVDQF